MTDQLLAAGEASDKGKALEYFKQAMEKGSNAWDMHLVLFPAVQQVLNPPYINPHLPKMCGVCRELIPNRLHASRFNSAKQGCEDRYQLVITAIERSPG